MTDHAPCVICGGEVVQRKPSEQRSKWLLRQACGQECGQKYRNRDIAALMAEAMRSRDPCHCGNSILPYPGESRSKYLSRRCCSLRCARLLQWGARRRHQAAAAPKPAISAQSVEDYLNRGGAITRVPPAYVAHVLAALPLAEELRRIEQLRPSPDPRRWHSGGNSFLFGKPAPSGGAKP